MLDDLMQITKEVLPKYCKKDSLNLDLTGDSQQNNSLTLADLQSPPNLEQEYRTQPSNGVMSQIINGRTKSSLQQVNHYATEAKRGTNFEEGEKEYMKLSQLSVNRNTKSKSSIEQMDNEYLGSVDVMEQQNRVYQKEIEQLVADRDDERQKQAMMQKQMEQLFERISELEIANKKSENLAGERQQQL